jgi:glycerol kinase
MPDQVILSIDQGTTNTKALLIDRKGEPVFRTFKAVDLLQPQPGFLEQDPIELWQSVCAVIANCVAYARKAGIRIEGIAISNQRETALMWQREADDERSFAFGKPITNAISWQCRRSATYCDRLLPYASRIRQKTGLPLDPLVSASKWAWMFEWQPELLEGAKAGKVYLGNVDSWLIYNLTSGKVHATDHTNASRTALLNLSTLDWDDDLLNLFSIPRLAMPQIFSSSGSFGVCSGIPALDGVPIVSTIGDSHAALVGQRCFRPGTIKATYGTGSSLMAVTSALVKESDTLARTIAWSIKDYPHFALEGNIAMTGSAVRWVGDFLGLANPTEDAVALADTVSDAAGVIFVPAMVGLGAPYWDYSARGMVSNLERSHTAAHLARASIDAIAYQVADVFFAMEKATNIELPALFADGAATRNNTLMQSQADLLFRPVHRSNNEELSALGAARLGGVTLGWWGSVDDFEGPLESVQTFMPELTVQERNRRYDSWRHAVRRVRLSEVDVS